MDAIDSHRPGAAVFYPAKSTYVVFGILWLTPSVLLILALIKRPPNESLWTMAAIVTAYGITLIAWVTRYRLEIRDGVVKYRTLFRGEVGINLADVESARLVVGTGGRAGPLAPPIRIEVISRVDTVRRVISINVKVFRRQDVDYLMSLLSKAI